MKKLLSILLALCMLCPLLASCTKPQETSAPSTSAQPTSSDSETTADATPAPLAISKNKLFLFEIESYNIAANQKDGLSWTTSDPTIATVDENGNVKGLKKGSAVITVSNEKGEKAECSVTVVNIFDYAEIVDPSTIEVKQSVIDDTIKAEYESMADYFATNTSVDREAKEGDITSIDYVGTLEGETEPFEGGTGSYDLKLGSGSFIDGFEDGLIGSKKGDKVTLNLTFPENYGAEGTEQGKLNGKKVTFVVTVKDVLESVPAEVTDALVEKATSGEYKTVESFTEYLKEAIFEYEAVNSLLDACKYNSYPEDMISYYSEDYIDMYYRSYAESYGISLESLLTAIGMTMDDLNKEAKENAIGQFEEYCLYFSVYKDGNTEIPEETYNKYALEYAEYNDYKTVDELIAAVSKAMVDNYVYYQYSLDDLISHVKLVNDVQ